MDAAEMGDLIFSEFGRFFTNWGVVVAIPIGVSAVCLVVSAVASAIHNK